MKMSELPRFTRNVALSLGLALSVIVATSAQVSGGNEEFGIAAIINDQVISKYDVQQRINLILASGGVRPEGEELERLSAQVLRNLIDEELKIQEARRLEVDVFRQEVDESIADMAKRNNMSVSEIEQALIQSGTGVTTLRRQIAADLAWDTIVRGMFGPQVSITQEEVDAVYQQTIDNSNKPQYNLSEIFLRVDSPDQDETVKRGAYGLLDQLRQGAPFPALAQQFSQSASASSGGDIGWIQDGQLAPELNQAIVDLEPGQVTTPIRTVSGYYLIAVRGKKLAGGIDLLQTPMVLRQIVVPLQEDVSDQQMLAAANYLNQFAQRIRSCGHAESIQKEIPNSGISPKQDVVVGNLPPMIRNQLLSLDVGRATQPMPTQQGLHIFILCERKELEAQLPNRMEIENRLAGQQVSMMARRYLRDLRNDAVVEYR